MSFLHQFHEYLSAFHRFSTDDILVNLNVNNSIKITDKQIFTNGLVQKKLKESNLFFKEYGVNSLCVCRGVIELNFNGKIILSPIEIANVTYTENKYQKLLTIFQNEEDYFVNPFVKFFFKEQLTVKNLTQDFEILTFLKENFVKSISENECYLDNFHPYRYEFINELEGLIKSSKFSNSLKAVLGENHSSFSTYNFSEKNLFPANQDQLSLFKKSENESIIIQGPPGTGKSQTITNLIGKFSDLGKKTIVVSEKKAALEVIYSKLKSKKLDLISIIATSKFDNKSILEELKNTWIQFENYNDNFEEKINSEHKKINIERILSCFLMTKSIGGISLKNYFAQTTQLDFNPKKKVQFTSVASIEEFHQFKEEIKPFQIQDFKILARMNASVLSMENEQFSLMFQELFSLIQKNKVLFDFNHFSDVEVAVKKAIDFQHFTSSVFTNFTSILTKHHKRFLSLYKKWKQFEIKKQKFDFEINHWIQFPTLDEINTLKTQFSGKGFIQKIKWKNTWKKWTRTPDLEPKKQLETIEKYLKIEIEIQKLRNDLFELGIANINEIETIYSLIQTTDIELFEQFKKEDKSTTTKILNSHQELSKINSLSKEIFDFKSNNEFLNTVELADEHFHRILELKNILKNATETFFQNIKQVENFDDLQQLIYTSNWQKFVIENPVFQNFSFHDLYLDCKKYADSTALESDHFALSILSKQKAKFDAFHTLINTSNSKLNSEQKALKEQLKKGKSILVKEFAKQKKHASLRQLFESEAALWIDVLKPIWLTNPSKLAVSFPLKPELFDLLIFDEAGRIPLSHSVGALQRAKQVIVAGDPQQMEPSSLFSSSEESKIDVLHQASFYLKNFFLSHHYRSRNSRLIEFSNKYFYDNKLKVFPDFKAMNEDAISFHYVSNASYENRSNRIEAQTVANKISSLINSKDKLGIVAFSETQLQAIFDALSSINQEKLLERIEHDTLFFRSLEQVQGEECDNLIISFGYAYNPEGKFEMRFGPLNQYGGKKRLNVLFTRARKKIDFFASVKSTDFPVSDNESIRILWLWFCFIESEKCEKQNVKSDNLIDFKEIVYKSQSAMELANFITIYEERGWNFSF
jgi:hypothetical protein